MESLDVEADIVLNGCYLARHKSAFYPFLMDVKRFLRDGENTLLVRLTTGLETVSEADLSHIKKCINTEALNGRPDRGDKRRAFIRKPQYVFGWDWGPRVGTCGIMKDVILIGYKKLAIRGVHMVTLTADAHKAELEIRVEVENLHPFSSFDAEIKLGLFREEKSVWSIAKIEHLRSGLNFIRYKAEITDPMLWWPNGMGEQNLYDVEISACAGDAAACYPPFKYGIRTVRLNLDSTNSMSNGERLFAVEINGVKTFCKGSNWIPADSIYARVTDEKYERLVSLAKEANFTMLRVWGGGIYERDVFYEACDRKGIMVWQDFMFACAMYPDNREDFTALVEKEMDYQTRRLRNHPSIVLFCGSNENHMAFDEWWDKDIQEGFYGGAVLYNKLAPLIVERNCPNIPYWNGAPYGGEKPNGDEMGARSYWQNCMMHPDMEKRIEPRSYDGMKAKFICEFGYIGPCALSTIERFHAGASVEIGGPIWRHHNNAFEKDTILAGIQKHYRDSANMPLADYLLYAGLCQGLMLGYALESMRYAENCWGGLFWMYSDCWGEIGWTIVDYYLKRKTAYYYAKRAFEPIRLIMREQEDGILIVGINDTGRDLHFSMDYGYTAFDGGNRLIQTADVHLPAYTRKRVLTFKKTDADERSGIYFAAPHHSDILPATLRSCEFRQLKLPVPKLEISDIEGSGECLAFSVKSHTFAHAVHFNLGEDIILSDEYFDLLPGESRRIMAGNVPQGFKIEEIRPRAVVS